MNTNIKKAIAGVVLASGVTGSSVYVDTTNITDREIRNSIEKAIVEGKIPQVDISKVSLDRVANGYFEVAKQNGVSLIPTEEKVDLYEKIRDTKANNGEKLDPQTDEILVVK